MRKLTAITIILVLTLLASCVPDTPDPPYGVWVSEEPRIVLFFKPEYRIPVGPLSYLGFYTVEGVETKIFANFGNGLRFEIFNLTGLSEEGGIVGSGRLLVGNYRVAGSEIRYTLTPYFQERLGISTIVFRLMEDYDPIDPYYWFPHFFPRSE